VDVSRGLVTDVFGNAGRHGCGSVVAGQLPLVRRCTTKTSAGFDAKFIESLRAEAKNKA